MVTVQQHVALIAQDFPLGLGKIEPAPRIAHGDITEAQLNEFVASLGRYYVPVGSGANTIPAQCVDGRPRADGSYEPQPKAAAGTFSAVMGDALTNGSLRTKGADAAEHARAVYTFFVRHGYAVGGHDAEHAPEGGCGCGAEDNLAAILTFICTNGVRIREFLESVGVGVEHETHELIIERAAALLQDGYVAGGAALRQAFVDAAGEESIETLSGPHNEVVLVVNTAEGTTTDRAALAASYNNLLQAFVVDGWSLQTAANALSLSPAEAAQKFAAMLYYNVATAAVLAGTSLRVAAC